MEAEKHVTPEYAALFNGITDTINELQNMIDRLKCLQQQAEELFID